MQNISEKEYEKFVIGQLAPMSDECQKDHVYFSMVEELLEVECVELQIQIIKKELEIWKDVKPTVKFLRQFAKCPTLLELRTFKQNTLVKRTLPNGTKVEKTFNEHIFDLENELKTLLEKTLIDELGDVLFFYVAMGTERFNPLYKGLFNKAQAKLDYYIENKVTSYEALRVQNHAKLLARYTNGYETKQDLQRS